MVIDSQGRRTGYERKGGKRYGEIPESNHSRIPSAGWGEGFKISVFNPRDENYILRVAGFRCGTYGVTISCDDLNGQGDGRILRAIPTGPGEIHAYKVHYDSNKAASLAVSGAYPGEGNETGGANDCLTYANPLHGLSVLPAGQASLNHILFYGKQVRTSSFRASLNGAPVTRLFHPKPGGYESVSLYGLKKGKNVLKLSIQGTIGKKTVTDTDELILEVP